MRLIVGWEYGFIVLEIVKLIYHIVVEWWSFVSYKAVVWNLLYFPIPDTQPV